MNTARDISTGPIGSTVVEALTALFAPDLRRRVLDEALALEGCANIPEDSLRAQAFVEGPLRLVVKRRVGDVMAGFLLDTLEPLFRRPEDEPLEDAHDEPTEALPATVLPPFEEDDEDRETDVYDSQSLSLLRARLRAARPRSGVAYRAHREAASSDPEDA